MQDLSDLYSPGQALGGSGATIGRLLSPLISNSVYFIAILSFAGVVFAGVNYISSSGDKSKVEQATTMLNYSLVGLALATSAFVIMQIVGRVGGFDFLNPGL